MSGQASDHHTALSRPAAPAPAEATERRQAARNIRRHLASLGLTKAGDGLADAKLVLSWLMTHLGAPNWMVGLLVPIREAGALLPQLLAAARLQAVTQRKRVWALASVVQGLALWAMAAMGLVLDGIVAGVALLAAMTVMALSRSAASVTYKDVLGRTVAKGRRGSVTGTAASVASVVTILFAGALVTGIAAREVLVPGALALAGAAFISAGAIFLTLDEPEDDGGADTARPLARVLEPLRADTELRRFILARGLLTATALAPPYLVMIGAQSGGSALDALGAMVLASALASLISSAVWGRLADRSSRLVLAVAGGLAAMAIAASIALALAGLGPALPGALFVLMLAHQGVRVSRATHLVDMAPPDARADYAALSNTAIGLALLATGAFGALASVAGPLVTLAVFAMMAVAGGGAALQLKDTDAGAERVARARPLASRAILGQDAQRRPAYRR